ncbi:hypothetical protein LZP97_25590 [Rhodococcus sp. DMF-1]|uniref:hypothetical protein n=1 Tax=Rhodococcus TaxID=1827 RepID=UPI00066093A9|nr:MULTISPECIES: hypothetical protein [Rhodococcus]UIR36912.1 hypothetical protein LZP97_25590 [Rhodococcus sp. DMF-1]
MHVPRFRRTRRIARAALLAVVAAAMLPSTAEARPVVDHYAGSADRGRCILAYTHDRGHLYVIRVTRRGETVVRTVRRLPTSSPYTLVDTIDLGLVRTWTCEYPR